MKTIPMRRLLPAVLLAAIGLSSSFAAPPVAGLTAEQNQWLAKAERHEKAGWIYLHIEGAPHARGFQHGYLLAAEIAAGIRAMRADWEYETAMEWTWLQEQAAAMFTANIDEENLAELDGIVAGLQAAGVASSRPELIAYNAFLELSWYWWPQELQKIKDGHAPPSPIRGPQSPAASPRRC